MTTLDRRKFVERLAEEAAGRQDLKTLYRINKMLNSKCNNFVFSMPTFVT